MVMDADDRLIAELADNVDRAFDALVLDHQDRLYTIALRMLGDPGDAEEAAQDALVRAYRALASYDRARIAALRLRPWLTTIVLNRCRTVAGRRATRGPRPMSIDGDPDRPITEPAAPESAAPAALAERHAERERWADLLGALPVAYRTAIVLRHVDGLSYPEAAEALGRPEGTVKAQVHRGIALLRTMQVDGEVPGRPFRVGARRLPFAVAFAACLSWGVYAIPTVFRLMQAAAPTTFAPGARADWEGFARRIPRGAKVFASWQAGEQFLLWAPDAVYVNVLDPIFMYAKNPELYRLFAAYYRVDPAAWFEGVR